MHVFVSGAKRHAKSPAPPELDPPDDAPELDAPDEPPELVPLDPPLLDPLAPPLLELLEELLLLLVSPLEPGVLPFEGGGGGTFSGGSVLLVF